MSAKKLQWFAWSPSIDTVAAVLTEIAMVGLYWVTTHLLTSGWDGVLVFGVLTNLGLNVAFPVWWITYHRNQPLSELGITTKRWLPSLLIGIAVAAFSSFGLRQAAAGVDWLPHLLFNAVILWEPFFVFCWLGLRFDRAFGIVPGVLLAGASFAAYHVGTYPPAMLPVLLATGVGYAAVFRLTSNLLIVWPFVWAVASSIGTLMGEMQFSWNQVATWSVILLIQLGIIGWTWLREGRKIRGKIQSIADFAPEDAETGVGLALQDAAGRYLFFLAGTRHSCPPGELFYAGIGGHREAGEDWLACAHREVTEEIGTDIEILSAPVTWHVSEDGTAQLVNVSDRPRPLALYEMIHPPDTPRAGELYRLVVYRAKLLGAPEVQQLDELQGVIALTSDQVIRGPERSPTLARLIEEGGSLVAGGETVSQEVRVHPLGTAAALARILRREQERREG